MRPTRLLATIATTAALAVALGTGLTACSSGPAEPANLITMTSDTCGGPWHAGPGWTTFQLRNGNDVGGEIDLTDPKTGGIYAEVADFGPQTTTPMRIDLGSGQYRFRCLFQDTDPMLGTVVTVAGNAAGTPAQLGTPFNDLVQPAKTYQSYIEASLKTLLTLVTPLSNDLQAGHLAAAKRDWLPAHLQYQRLGAAYDAFGDADDAIDGRADAIGTDSPDWTGFYRIEYGLWHGQPASELKPFGPKLKSDVAALLAGWPQQEIELIDLGLRTHEIIENALQFQLSGHDDYGSGTTLATTLANIDGDRELLKVLQPVIAPRYQGLPAVYEWESRLQADLLKERGPSGQWTPVAKLTTAERQQLDADCGELLQALDPIPTITEPRN
ncbi:MAG TPA: EfeM/EfeO family lipoprotein [Trebonia sp.]|nr:EfeM/EfeO family lipoprotein [Trebonia sp.]